MYVFKIMAAMCIYACIFDVLLIYISKANFFMMIVDVNPHFDNFKLLKKFQPLFIFY